MGAKDWKTREPRGMTWDMDVTGPNGERVSVVVKLSGAAVADAARRAASNRTGRATIGSGALTAKVER